MQKLHFFYCKNDFFIADSLLLDDFLCNITEMWKKRWNGCRLYTNDLRNNAKLLDLYKFYIDSAVIKLYFVQKNIQINENSWFVHKFCHLTTVFSTTVEPRWHLFYHAESFLFSGASKLWKIFWMFLAIYRRKFDKHFLFLCILPCWKLLFYHLFPSWKKIEKNPWQNPSDRL